MATKKKSPVSEGNFIDITSCTYLGSKSTPNKYISMIKLKDKSVIRAWSDDKPSLKCGEECSVELNKATGFYNLYC